MKKQNSHVSVFKKKFPISSQKSSFKKSPFRIKKSVSKKRFLLIVVLFLLSISVITGLTFSILNRVSNAPDLSLLEELWNKEDYVGTYNHANDILDVLPFNNMALTYLGYSSFYLALSSTGSVVVHNYIDEAINSLRLALLNARASLIPQLEYMLGKAYFHKNRLSAYYFYSDLAIKYLHSAHNNGYNANDIYEYLGLSYSSLDMTEESIAYFTEALLVNDSDVLHVALAEQYYKKENYDAAKPYLQRVKTESKNVDYIVQCTNLLGQIYISEEKYTEAQSEFDYALSVNELSADAHYGLGLIYEYQGDTVKARAQWRRTLEIEINHQGARLKMI